MAFQPESYSGLVPGSKLSAEACISDLKFGSWEANTLGYEKYVSSCKEVTETGEQADM